jgi:hemerythrin superfamily protein
MNMRDTSNQLDAIGLLTSQHREVDQLWTQLQSERASGANTVKDLADRIVALLSKHDAIETRMLYPEVREAGGEQLADHSLDEHQTIRNLLNEVDGKDPREGDVFDTFSQCISAVMAHVQEEEGTIFPMLRENMSDDELRDLGDRMSSALDSAPTHPHPTTPNNPAGATIAGAVTGMVDRARDAVTGESDRKDVR